ncbi:hypothetical protein PINS_up012402 [Pythium insidiosum]|nr:hypothetical protein PINS_up012402 [Pythium insidiosum]
MFEDRMRRLVRYPYGGLVDMPIPWIVTTDDVLMCRGRHNCLCIETCEVDGLAHFRKAISFEPYEFPEKKMMMRMREIESSEAPLPTSHPHVAPKSWVAEGCEFLGRQRDVKGCRPRRPCIDCLLREALLHRRMASEQRRLRAVRRVSTDELSWHAQLLVLAGLSRCDGPHSRVRLLGSRSTDLFIDNRAGLLVVGLLIVGVIGIGAICVRCAARQFALSRASLAAAAAAMARRVLPDRALDLFGWQALRQQLIARELQLLAGGDDAPPVLMPPVNLLDMAPSAPDQASLDAEDGIESPDAPVFVHPHDAATAPRSSEEEWMLRRPVTPSAPELSDDGRRRRRQRESVAAAERHGKSSQHRPTAHA